MIPQFEPVWSVRFPTANSPTPSWMSFHFFAEARRCPRSAVLQRSVYENLWSGRGYPRRANVSALVGLVIHSATETIVEAFSGYGVESMDDPKTMDCLRGLGGYLAVLSRELDRVLALEKANPRQKSNLPALANLLKLQLPRMRQSVQQILVSRKWNLARKPNRSFVVSTAQVSMERKPLPVGIHLEVELQDSSLYWKGRVDLLTLTADGCSIVDWKTGKQSEEHEEQIKIYGLLWDGDSELNPSQIPLTSLTLSYGGRQLEVPVASHAERTEARTLLQIQTTQLREELSSNPSPARPSLANCRYCQVKLICDACSFWEKPALLQPVRFGDLEIFLIEPRNEVSWSATWKIDGKIASSVLLKKGLSEDPLWDALEPGCRLRLSDALISFREDGEVPLVSFTSFTEALLLKPDR